MSFSTSDRLELRDIGFIWWIIGLLDTYRRLCHYMQACSSDWAVSVGNSSSYLRDNDGVYNVIVWVDD